MRFITLFQCFIAVAFLATTASATTGRRSFDAEYILIDRALNSTKKSDFSRNRDLLLAAAQKDTAIAQILSFRLMNQEFGKLESDQKATGEEIVKILQEIHRFEITKTIADGYISSVREAIENSLIFALTERSFPMRVRMAAILALHSLELTPGNHISKERLIQAMANNKDSFNYTEIFFKLFSCEELMAGRTPPQSP